MKTRQKLVACMLAVLMLVPILVLVPQLAQARPSQATGTVEERIEQLRQRFPHGSFFTVNNERCWHSAETPNMCSNCRLSGVMNSMGYSGLYGIRDAYTCVAFARYAFWWVFGVEHNVAAYSGGIPPGTHRINSRAEALPGDLIIWNPGSRSGRMANTGHMAMYLGDGLVFESNSPSPNQVAFGNDRTGWGEPSLILRANNYFEINSHALRGNTYSIIVGTFTLPYAAGTGLTVELRHGGAYGELVSYNRIEVLPENDETPINAMFVGIPPGVYSLVITMPGHTSFTINNIIATDIGGIVDLNRDYRFPWEIPLKPGNVTGSEQINISDLNALLQNWNRDYENADFTGSGQVNIVDLYLLMQNWMAHSVVVD